jgi:hypothetical protein
MSKDAANLKYPIVNLLTDAIMSLMCLNVLATSNLLLFGTPRVLIEAWMKGLDGGSVAALEQWRSVIERMPIADQFGVLHDHAIVARAKAR